MRVSFISRYCIAVIAFAAVILSVAFIAAADAEQADVAHPYQSVDLVLDQASGSFRFFVGKHEVARLDTRGLHVRGEINVGGPVTHIGRDGFDHLVVTDGSDEVSVAPETMP